ncbi:ABC-type branched-subunit amino acid transport system substrate-binding protein [Marmoricola sp. OAE513]|uniref:ABC transporter substrate-binding protein n=1 Tax=Marmoricola sp. OAE513 TaxID=2817894 RepID=UPI001AEABC01
MTSNISRTIAGPRTALIGFLTVAVLSVSACGGSSMDPKDVAEANAKVQGSINGTGAGTGTGTGIGVDPGTGTGTSTGSGTGTGTGTATGSGTGTGTGTSTGSGTGTGTGTSAPPTGSGVKAASCAGFKNTTGITDSTITLGNIADISGPVPGILSAARDAAKAYVAFFNSKSTICGRKLALKSYDSQTNTSGDAVATQKTCDETFAAVGSMEAFDTGGLSASKACKIPEIHAIITNQEREQGCPNCFATESGTGGGAANIIPDYFTKINKPATQKAAFLYVSVGASVGGAKRLQAATERRGWKYVYTSGFDIAEFNYGPYAQKLKAAGARTIFFLGSSDMAIRMQRAFKAQGYKPDYFLMTATSYDKNYASAGSDVEGSIVFADFVPIEEASKNAELRLYMQWLQQVAPGATPTYFGAYAWSAARLFVQEATKLGGKLSRPALINSLKKVRGWTSNGLHAPHDVGLKKVATCWRFIQMRGGVWKPFGPAKFMCGGRS